MSVFQKLSNLQSTYSLLSENVSHSQLLKQFLPNFSLMHLSLKLASMQHQQLSHFSIESEPFPANSLMKTVRKKLQEKIGVGVCQNTLTTLDIDEPIYDFYHLPQKKQKINSDIAVTGVSLVTQQSDDVSTFQQLFNYEIIKKHKILIQTHKSHLNQAKQISHDILNYKHNQSNSNIITTSPFSTFIQQTQKSISDTLACSNILSELVLSNSRAKSSLFALTATLKPTQKSQNLTEILKNIRKKRQKGVLAEIIQILPFSTSVQKLSTILPNNREFEKFYILTALSALKTKEKAITLQITEQNSANLLINQFCQFSGKRTAVLLAAASVIKNLQNELSKNVRIIHWNKFRKMRKTTNFDMFQVDFEQLRINFFGEQKTEINFELIELDLVVVDFESVMTRKIDFAPVLREINAQTFDFAIINRYDQFISQNKLNYVNLCEIPAEFKMIINSNNSKLRYFNSAFQLLKIDQRLLNEFQPEFLTKNDDILLFQLEEASKSAIQEYLVEFDTEAKETKIIINNVNFPAQKLSKTEIMSQIYTNFQEIDDSTSDITTQLEKVIGKQKLIENDVNQTEKLNFIRNSILKYKNVEKAPSNVALCLRDNLLEDCAVSVLAFLEGCENDINMGVKGEVLQDQNVQFLVQKLSAVKELISRNDQFEDEEFQNFTFEGFLALNFDDSYNKIDALEVGKRSGKLNYNSLYNGNMSRFGRSLGFVLSNSRIQQNIDYNVLQKQNGLIKNYNSRILIKKLQFVKFNYEFVRNLLEEQEEQYEKLNLELTKIPDFQEFKFTGYFNFNIPKDIFTKYFTVYLNSGYQLQLKSEYFEKQQLKKTLFPFPIGISKQILGLFDFSIPNQRFLIISEDDNLLDQLSKNLFKYSSLIVISNEIPDLNFTEIVIFHSENSQKILQNLTKIPSKIRKITEVFIQQLSNYHQNPIISAFLTTNENQQLRAKITQNGTFGQIQSKNSIEICDLKEKEISDEYFKSNLTGRYLLIARKIIQQIYVNNCQDDHSEFVIEPYHEQLKQLQKDILQDVVVFDLKTSYFPTVDRKMNLKNTTPHTLQILNQQPKLHHQNIQNIYLRIRKNLNFLSSKTINSQDTRRDTYQANIYVPILLHQEPFKRFLCPKCCVVNEHLSTCLSIIQTCARSAYTYSRCSAQGNFQFPDIYYYNSYMQLYTKVYKSSVHQDISSIILLLQINKQNRDYVQHVLTERLLNLIYAQFAEPSVQTYSINVIKTKEAIHANSIQSVSSCVDYSSMRISGKNVQYRLLYQIVKNDKKLVSMQSLKNFKQLQNVEFQELKVTLVKFNRNMDGVRHSRYDNSANLNQVLSLSIKKLHGVESQSLIEFANVFSCVPGQIIAFCVKMNENLIQLKKRCDFQVVVDMVIRNLAGSELVKEMKMREIEMGVDVEEPPQGLVLYDDMI